MSLVDNQLLDNNDDTNDDLDDKQQQQEWSPKEFHTIPGPKPSLPFIGTGWQYLKYVGRYDLGRLHEANEHKYYTYGPIVKEEYQWRKPIIHIYDPKDFEVVLKNQGRCPIRPPNDFVTHYRLRNKDRYANVGLSNMMGDQWYRHRQLLAPALMSLKAVHQHIPSQNKICDDFLDYIWQIRDQTNDVLMDLSDATNRLALESICMMCLDSRLHCFTSGGGNGGDDDDDDNSDDGQQLIAATGLLFESYNELYYGLPFWKLVATSSYRKLDSAETAIYDIVSKYIEIGLNKIQENSDSIGNNNTDADDGADDRLEESPRSSVLQTLLKTDGLTDSDIKITIIDFIAGGIFTVSNTLCFLFYHLAANPDAQQRLYEEIRDVMGDNSDGNDDLTVDMLAHMPYLKACVAECFRLTNPVPGIMRVMTEPTVLSGYHIPANTVVFSHLMVTSRLKQYFEDPLSYRPERWLDTNRLNRYHRFASIPFGFGNRMCTGKRFAELQLYLTTARLIKRYQIQALQPELDLKFCFIIIPSHKVSLKLKKRD
ncbi:ecdysone 20-monooxygenase-like [Oppia nitens]|uniref:ecdysone 20-monooxygenase-like n=1 Tax=Oppia nitens TaxID=1686743 RepID=UPI0023DA6381|nr:ecdysone 20-monooxygenase-like [Oppia nitens]